MRNAGMFTKNSPFSAMDAKADFTLSGSATLHESAYAWPPLAYFGGGDVGARRSRSNAYTCARLLARRDADSLPNSARSARDDSHFVQIKCHSSGSRYAISVLSFALSRCQNKTPRSHYVMDYATLGLSRSSQLNFCDWIRVEDFCRTSELMETSVLPIAHQEANHSHRC